eukprot:CAMPEP_0181332906 /NCGR_PEP_ID=MMETSP1101-20121128/25366_1 /TAXON_ID=46948 /ORGANISM="Rhodomonas abbreviata, Strain Caron Lab Isolate" /LENGTH=73 /DNA_ID=CAMNT_0023442627 /DNA_START=11 /DNA_END=232 /DNA_ORIENTATION=-
MPSIPLPFTTRLMNFMQKGTTLALFGISCAGMYTIIEGSVFIIGKRLAAPAAIENDAAAPTVTVVIPADEKKP